MSSPAAGEYFVVAGSSNDDFVSVAAVDAVVESASGERLIGLVTLDQVARKFDRIGKELGTSPDRPVVEADFIDAEVFVLIGAVDNDGVVGSDRFQNQTPAVVREIDGDIGGSDARIENDGIHRAFFTFLPDLVVAEAGGEAIDVRTGAAFEIVAACSAIEDVVAIAAVEFVASCPADKDIGTAAGIEEVGACRADQRIVRDGALQVNSRRRHRGIDDVRACPDRPVGETDAGQSVVRLLAQCVADFDDVFGAYHPNEQGIGEAATLPSVIGALQLDIGRRQAGIELDPVEPRFTGGNDVVAEAGRETIYVGTVVARHIVVAGSADQDVVAVAAPETVVAGATDQCIAATKAIEFVVLGRAGEDVRGGGIRSVEIAVIAPVIGRVVRHPLRIEHGAVGKADLIYRIEIADIDLVVAADEAQPRLPEIEDTVAVIPEIGLQHEIVDRERGIELDDVVGALPPVFLDDILTETGREAIGVRASAARQIVVAGAADQDVGIGAAIEFIVAAATVQRDAESISSRIEKFVRIDADDAVARRHARRGQPAQVVGADQRQHAGIAQRTAVGEAQLLDPIEVGADAALDRDPVVGPGDPDDKVFAVAALRQRQIGGRDAGAELDRVFTVVPVADDVLTITPVEHIGIVTPTAAEPVVAGPADQGIVAINGIQLIVAGFTRQRVAKQVSGQGVVAGGRHQRSFNQLRVAQRAAVNEAQLLDPIEVGADAALDRDPVVGPGDPDDEVLAAVALRHQQIGGRDAGTELDRVFTVVPIADDVLTITPVEHVSVVTPTAAEPVAARPADQGIVAINRIQRIVAGPTRQRVGKQVP